MSDIKNIHLTVKRQQLSIPVDTIIYALVVDKLCTIRLADGEPLTLFLTVSSLMSMLPADSFLQIRRNCIISLRYVRDIDSRYVIMSDSTLLPYSQRKKSALLYSFRQYLANRPLSEISADEVPDFISEFHCFDRCPFAFCIIEVFSDDPQLPGNFIFRYANEAMAQLEKLPLNMIINFPVRTVLQDDIINELPTFAHVALSGESANVYRYGSLSNQFLHMMCFQPRHGYCACILAPAKSL